MQSNTPTLTSHLDGAAAHHRWIIIATIMMLSILEVLDSTIVNVALPSMMASLGADQNQVTWVLTSYVVASAIVLPLTGFLTNRVGRKQFLLLCAAGFMLSSFLCGISTSLSEIVLFRIMQGACGASLIPISQTILRETFPPDQQGKAMAIWGLGIMCAPVLGPTLGGFITEHASWRWVFYINLPFCLLGIFLIMSVIPKAAKIKQHIDILSLILMIVGVGCLQIFLDKGNENGWFSSDYILGLATVSGFCILYFILRSLLIKNPLIKLNLFKDRNFALCSLVMLLFCGCVFSFITIQPMMLENYFNYSTITAGVTMGATGVASAFGMILSSQLMTKVKVKYLVSIGLFITSMGLWHESLVNLHASQSFFLMSNATIGFGMGLIMVPLSTYVLATLDQSDIAEASGLFSYARMLGTSIGISIVSTLVSQLTQISWHTLSGHIASASQNVTYWLQAQQLHALTPLAIARLGHVISTQSGIIGFIDAFHAIAIVLLCTIPIALSFKSVKMGATNPGAH